MVSEKEINNLDLAKHKDDSQKGLILVVGLEHPKELHDIHNCPLADEKMKVNWIMLSNIQEKYPLDKFKSWWQI